MGRLMARPEDSVTTETQWIISIEIGFYLASNVWRQDMSDLS